MITAGFLTSIFLFCTFHPAHAAALDGSSVALLWALPFAGLILSIAIVHCCTKLWHLLCKIVVMGPLSPKHKDTCCTACLWCAHAQSEIAVVELTLLRSSHSHRTCAPHWLAPVQGRISKKGRVINLLSGAVLAAAITQL